MMYPILCKVQYESLYQVFRQRDIWVQLGFSIVVNWIVAPLFMVSQIPPRPSPLYSSPLLPRRMTVQC